MCERVSERVSKRERLLRFTLDTHTCSTSEIHVNLAGFNIDLNTAYRIV